MQSAEQYVVQLVMKAVDERKNERSVELSTKQYGPQNIMNAVGERKNWRSGEPSTVFGTLAKSSRSLSHE